jgi:RHS repeat-associated protein
VNGTTRQIVWDPLGWRRAIATGQALTNESLVLPGGSVAFYAGGSLNAVRHADWLGSMRFTTAPNGTYLGSGAFAPFGEEYALFGSPQLNFENQRQTLASDLWDFPARELHSTQGRWISPDKAGLAAVDITDPQTWNRYSYVRNTPTGLTDPSGLGCVYLNDAGGGVESIDNGSNQGECWANGGYWADGYIPSASSVWIDPNSNNITIDSSVNGFLARTLAGNEDSGQWGAFSQMFPVSTSIPDILNNALTLSNPITAANYQAAMQDRAANALAQAINKTGIQALNNLVTNLVCKGSPSSRILTSMRGPGLTLKGGAIGGAAKGALSGSVFGVEVGVALPGAVIGGVAGAGIGVVAGLALAGVCSMAGAY